MVLETAEKASWRVGHDTWIDYVQSKRSMKTDQIEYVEDFAG
jgi:hypothetical protein